MAKSLQTISSLSLEGDVSNNLTENIGKLDLSNIKWPDWLQQAQTPINWLPKRFENINSQEVIAKAKERVESDDLPFDTFVQTLALVYEYCQKRNFEEADVSVKSANSLLKFDGEINDNIKKIQKYERAFRHVVLAIQAQISILKNHELEENKDFVPYRYSSLTKDEQSAIEALKAKFFSLYRKEGFQKAVEFSRRAIELKPDEPMWMVLLADSLRRISKYECHYAQPVDQIEEMQLLEKAVSLERNPRYMVQLAVRYNTCAVSTFYKYKNTDGYFSSELYTNTKLMEEKALALCKEALELAPDDEVVNRRCGFALMKASYNSAKKNKNLIKKAFEKSLEISPSNSMTLHYLGKYYTKFELNNEKALECFENASKEDANYYAQFDLIKLKFKMFGVDGYEPSKDLDNMLEKQSQLDNHSKHIVLSNIVSYLILFKRNLNKALEYFEQLIDEVEEQSIVKEHQPMFTESNEKIDLYKIIANEIMMAEKEVILDKQVIYKIKNKVPEYFSKPVEKTLREQTFLRLTNVQKYDPCQNLSRTANSSASSNWRSRNSSELEEGR